MSAEIAWVTRAYKFSAAHRLYSPALDEAANRAMYGKCTNPEGHGHNYRVEVTVRGAIDPVTGMAADLGRLDGAVGELVVARFDHRHLNRDPLFAGERVPTGENIARAVWDLLTPHLPEGSLDRVRIVETRDNVFEYAAS